MSSNWTLMEMSWSKTLPSIMALLWLWRCCFSWHSQTSITGRTLNGLTHKFFRYLQALITIGTRYFHFELSLKPRHTPPAPRLRLLLVVFSFPFSFQFFTRRCLKNQFLVCPWLNKMTLLLSNVLHLL